jgi:hypothetical protein
MDSRTRSYCSLMVRVHGNPAEAVGMGVGTALCGGWCDADRVIVSSFNGSHEPCWSHPWYSSVGYR